MWRLLFAIGALAAGSSQAFALCKDGPPFACTVNGKPGTRQCLNGHISPCVPEAPPPATSSTATLEPKYYVLTVIYAPPGTKGASPSNTSASTVSYSSGSTTGTTTSASHAFKQAYSVTAKVGGGALGEGSEVGVSYGVTRNVTDTSSLNIAKSATSTIQATGPSANGIDHDRDVIYLWLNPVIDVTATPKSAVWTLNTHETADIQYVYVGWLKHPEQMPPGLTQRLKNRGLTQKDYAAILRLDQFADASPDITSRYRSLHTTFPYEPPYSDKDTPPTYNATLTTAQTATKGHSEEVDYTVGLEIKVSAGLFVTASLEFDDSWQWTNITSNTTSTGMTQSASVTVGGPAFGYTGPTDVEVYYDTIFKTFLFRFVPASSSPTIKGTVKDTGGKPAAFREVDMVAKGITYRTFANAKGEFRMFGQPSGPVTIRSGKTTHALAHVAPNTLVDLVLK